MAVKFSSFAEMPANFWGFLFCGVLWGFSFIIPGMTSSSILMAVGLLTPLIDGIAQLDLAVLIPWGLGMVGVMALFARIVSRLFDTHYSIAYHAVIGIVLASTIIIIPTDFASTAEMVWGRRVRHPRRGARVFWQQAPAAGRRGGLKERKKEFRRKPNTVKIRKLDSKRSSHVDNVQ